MLWRVGILTMLLAWMLLAAPAAAASIQRHVDSQGVIRISNSPATQPRQGRQDRSSTAATAPEPGSQTESGPSPAAQVKPSPQAQSSATQARENPSPALSPRPDRCQNPQPRAETRGLAAAPETGAEPLPVKKVAFTGVEAGPAAISEPQVAASRKPEVTEEGGIRRFRDHQGVLHITNANSGHADSGTQLLPGDPGGGSGKGLPVEQPGQAVLIPTRLPLQNISWNPDNHGFAALPTAAAAGGKAAPGPGNTISHYRDSLGVIHIKNVAPGAPESSYQPQVQVGAGPEDGRAPPPESRPPPLGETGSQLVQEAGARSGARVPNPPTALLSAPFWKPETALLAGIRRYQDHQGVWHLETAKKDPGLQGPPQLPRLADLGRSLTLAGFYQATGLPTGAIQSGPGPGRSYGGIAVVRDRRGRLLITNAQPQAGVGTGVGVAEARALLEPIIQEAARTYGLPASLIRAVIKVESNFASLAVSPKGAMGLMQLMPGTAAFLGVREPFNPRENILGGCRYLRLLVDFFGGSVPLALAGYNAGYHRVVACGYRVPDIKETQEFLTQVMGRYMAEEKKMLLPRI
jgi:hypothetical protein